MRDQMEQLGMVGPLSIVRTNLAELYISTGILRKALSQIDRATAQSREVHHVHGVAVGLAWRANALRILRRFDEAERTAVEGLRYCREHNAHEDELTTLCAQIELGFDADQPQSALDAVLEGLPLLEGHDNEGRAPLFQAWNAQALALLGRRAEAEAVLKDQAPPSAPWQHTQVRIDLAWAHAFRLLGRGTEALRLFQRALETAERIGYRYYQLLAHHELATFDDDPTVASRHARVANGLARSLGANLPREDAQRFLARNWGGPQA